jgi:ABC-2 type transport system permease protein
MTTATMTTTTDLTGRARASARRVRALARAEMRLLWRNRTALLYALLFPLGAVLLLDSSDAFAAVAGMGGMLVTSVTAIALGFVVYYNLVTALVARREELVLKRLRTGELTDAEIIAGTAVPSLALAWVQVAVTVVASAVLGELGMPVNALLVVLALVLGSVVFVLLAAASTAMTRTVEMAQVTTMPVLLLPFAFSGLVHPLSDLPAPLAAIGQVLPLTPVVDLMRLGLLGIDPDGRHLDTAATFAAAAPSLATGGAWILLGVGATRLWFRWEPRR